MTLKEILDARKRAQTQATAQEVSADTAVMELDWESDVPSEPITIPFYSLFDGCEDF